MKMEIKFKDYLLDLQEQSNKPFNLNNALKPFGISGNDVFSSDLLFGHLLDGLKQEFDMEQFIDPIDIATIAYELGYEEANAFLTDAPWLLIQVAKQLKDIPSSLL